MSQGKFITVEGVEGVGKSTNIDLIATLIKQAGHDVLISREPGGTAIGERVRDILLDKQATGMAPMTELLLMFAARAQHIQEVIQPALSSGTWVVCDRFVDSSYAYQGGGRKMGAGTVAALDEFVLQGFHADATFILDLDVETGLKRAADVSEADRFESEEHGFFERVRTAFLERAGESHFHVVDAGQPLEDVQSEITRVMKELLR